MSTRFKIFSINNSNHTLYKYCDGAQLDVCQSICQSISIEQSACISFIYYFESIQNKFKSVIHGNRKSRDKKKDLPFFDSCDDLKLHDGNWQYSNRAVSLNQGRWHHLVWLGYVHFWEILVFFNLNSFVFGISL